MIYSRYNLLLKFGILNKLKIINVLTLKILRIEIGTFI